MTTQQSEDERWMDLALRLGRRNLGQTWPNPSVGCVIVKDGRLVGQGVTAPGGRPHAEPQALAQAGDAANGATVYVTLEPCAHYGKTPPCADALIASQVARVVVALNDPDPRVDGGGIAMLEAAGIQVTTNVRNKQAEHDQIGFLNLQTIKRPFVTLKLAQSMDGRIATANGESKWITGSEARRLTHLMRAQSDAIMVGRGTVEADDPELTVRISGLENHSPVRVVLASDGTVLDGTKLATDDGPNLWVFGKKAPSNTDEERVRFFDIGTEPTAVLNALASQGITRLFCEGGASLAASLLRADLVDELVLFTAPMTIGGTGLPSISDLHLENLAQSPRFEKMTDQSVGVDQMVIYRRA